MILPPPVSRPWVLTASASGILAAAVEAWRWSFLTAGVVVLVLVVRRHPVMAVVLTGVAVSATIATLPVAPLVSGEVDALVTLRTEVRDGQFGPWALVELGGIPALADLPEGSSGLRGERARIQGLARATPGTVAGNRHGGVISVEAFTVVSGPTSPIQAVGNAMRRRVTDRLSPLRGGRALLAGFLVGDVSGVDELDVAAMRRSGLSHFTAVSGSNVALFLLLLYLGFGALGVGPRRRAVIGLAGLPLFAAATGFEPSVLRAAAMAGIVLVGRLAGIALERWQVASLAVIGLIVVDPRLVSNTGFLLSVAATVGVMAGSRWPARTSVGRALAVTVGAQVAVAPLLVAFFGRVPLLSPLVNVIAAPVVTLATTLGAVGVIGPFPLADLGSESAGMVLWMARSASPWPQVGWAGLGTIAGLGAMLLLRPRWRSPVLLLGSLALALAIVVPAESLPVPGVVVLDVGQGDSILIAGDEGRFALVDGGPDPVALVEHLQAYGVRQLELVVLSHVHADHATGLIGLPGRIPIGTVWERTEPHRTPASDGLLTSLLEHGIRIDQPQVGDRWSLGSLDLVVEAPIRRYASPNDQSIVISVRADGRTMLLSGDIEEIAQAELPHLRADILKVPHQGAATSDPAWLRQVGSHTAVISVGENDFGHPADWVIEVLEAGGAAVIRTDQVGDVVIPLG